MLNGGLSKTGDSKNQLSLALEERREFVSNLKMYSIAVHKITEGTGGLTHPHH